MGKAKDHTWVGHGRPLVWAGGTFDAARAAHSLALARLACRCASLTMLHPRWQFSSGALGRRKHTLHASFKVCWRCDRPPRSPGRGSSTCLSGWGRSALGDRGATFVDVEPARQPRIPVHPCRHLPGAEALVLGDRCLIRRSDPVEHLIARNGTLNSEL